LFPNYDFLDELKNACIKIPLLEAIRETQILAKTIKELSIKNQEKKKKKKPKKRKSCAREKR